MEKNRQTSTQNQNKRKTYLGKQLKACQDAMHSKDEIRIWNLGKNQKHQNEEETSYLKEKCTL